MRVSVRDDFGASCSTSNRTRVLRVHTAGLGGRGTFDVVCAACRPVAASPARAGAVRVLELGATRLARLVVVVVHAPLEVLAHRVARVLLRTQRRLGLVHLVRVRVRVRLANPNPNPNLTLP